MKNPLHATLPLLVLDGASRYFHPGAILSGQYSVESMKPERATAAELSVLWYTEGKGEEDLAVHFFERLEPTSGRTIELAQPRPFSTRLPNSPLSYAGQIITIRWCVRLRVFFGGKDVFVEEPFQLGRVPSPRMEEPPAAVPAPNGKGSG
jgi:hypothetical protein